MLEVPQHILDERRISGAEQWDEVWEGVLHMVPPPNVEHQDFEWQLETWLRLHWNPTHRSNRVFHQVALSPDEKWIHNYRTPDIVLFTEEHLKNLQPTYCSGPCTVAVEIRSPNDESYEKLDFYGRLGVPEVWVIDRDTRLPEIHRLANGRYEMESPTVDGWLRSQVVTIMMRHASKSLTLQIAAEVSSRHTIP